MLGSLGLCTEHFLMFSLFIEHVCILCSLRNFIPCNHECNSCGVWKVIYFHFPLHIHSIRNPLVNNFLSSSIQLIVHTLRYDCMLIRKAILILSCKLHYGIFERKSLLLRHPGLFSTIVCCPYTLKHCLLYLYLYKQ